MKPQKLVIADELGSIVRQPQNTKPSQCEPYFMWKNLKRIKSGDIYINYEKITFYRPIGQKKFSR